MGTFGNGYHQYVQETLFANDNFKDKLFQYTPKEGANWWLQIRGNIFTCESNPIPAPMDCTCHARSAFFCESSCPHSPENNVVVSKWKRLHSKENGNPITV